MFDRQKAFNDAVVGLWQQQALSLTGAGGCRYRGNNNTRCAVGWLIPDKTYDLSLEGKSAYAYDVLDAIDPKYGEALSEDTLFLEEMQMQLHDDMRHTGGWNAEAFKQRAKDFARDYRLNLEIDMEC